jgi:hypothetical protein
MLFCYSVRLEFMQQGLALQGVEEGSNNLHSSP